MLAPTCFLQHALRLCNVESIDLAFKGPWVFNVGKKQGVGGGWGGLAAWPPPPLAHGCCTWAPPAHGTASHCCNIHTAAVFCIAFLHYIFVLHNPCLCHTPFATPGCPCHAHPAGPLLISWCGIMCHTGATLVWQCSSHL